LNACNCIAFADEIEGEIRRIRILSGGRRSRLFMERRGERPVLLTIRFCALNYFIVEGI